MNFYTYHNKPPFIVDEENEHGLYFDLSQYLSSKSNNYEFVTIYIPRKRLERMIKNNKLDGVVIGVSPVWFNDEAENKFLWLPSFYTDRDEFISLKSSAFEYNDYQSLIGKTVASVAGYYYFNINEAVSAGQLQRIDTIGELQVLELVKKGRANMGLVSQSVFKFLRKQGKLEDIFHISPTPHDSFSRRAFTNLDNADVHKEIQRLMKFIVLDPLWQGMLAQYE
ncbi:substrate-binding periplasmic protein [Thalassotalea atypica]|uniref:substrate-binding periplasmic protein n=1 Tax=Thalassotalea atypica TaxID=2054316 RepID=UPI00257358AC|nr:transporter substrate-binding domain-containing protein [Thalassotalea atypica]